jgi:hypothetical protein
MGQKTISDIAIDAIDSMSKTTAIIIFLRNELIKKDDEVKIMGKTISQLTEKIKLLEGKQ